MPSRKVLSSRRLVFKKGASHKRHNIQDIFEEYWYSNITVRYYGEIKDFAIHSTGSKNRETYILEKFFGKPENSSKESQQETEGF